MLLHHTALAAAHHEMQDLDTECIEQVEEDMATLHDKTGTHMSSLAGSVSKSNLYENPEHPPASTLNLSTIFESFLLSSCIRCRTMRIVRC